MGKWTPPADDWMLAEDPVEKQRRENHRRRAEAAAVRNAALGVPSLAGRACGYCGKATGPMHRDHLVPRSRGGGDDVLNCVVACQDCNLSKSNMTPSEWKPRGLPAWVYELEARLSRRYRMSARGRPGIPAAELAPARPNSWTCRVLSNGYEWTGDLHAVWEVAYSSMSDDYTPEEITADALLDEFLRYTRSRYPDGVYPISWYVSSPAALKFEAMPFQDEGHPDFLSYYTWPQHAETSERLEWLALPVEEHGWREDLHTKGGFIQEALGWRPSVLQASVDLLRLVEAARTRRSPKFVRLGRNET